jgi:ATP-dependent Zn protease
MTQNKYKLDVLAYHEAGHAAAACFLHLPFTGVQIIATGDLLGALELVP